MTALGRVVVGMFGRSWTFPTRGLHRVVVITVGGIVEGYVDHTPFKRNASNAALARTARQLPHRERVRPVGPRRLQARRGDADVRSGFWRRPGGVPQVTGDRS